MIKFELEGRIGTNEEYYYKISISSSLFNKLSEEEKDVFLQKANNLLNEKTRKICKDLKFILDPCLERSKFHKPYNFEV